MSTNDDKPTPSIPSTPDFEHFSDQVYRHRRNLLSCTLIILVCIVWEGKISQIPFNIDLSQKHLSLNWLLGGLNLYFLTIFCIAAMAEYKGWPSIKYNIALLMTEGGFGAESPFPHLTATTNEFMSHINKQINQGARGNISVKEHAQLNSLLTKYNEYQWSIFYYRNFRAVLDFWLPIFLALGALIKLCLITYDGINLIKII